jgi:hypothetical protein
VLLEGRVVVSPPLGTFPTASTRSPQPVSEANIVSDEVLRQAHRALPSGTPGRRQVLSAGAAGVVSLTLPAAAAATTGEVEVLASPGALTFTEVTATGFTVSWA